MPTTTIKHFRFDHLPPHLRAVSKPLGELAYQLEADLADGPEKSAGMRKLLEAKDCFVRAKLEMPKDETRTFRILTEHMVNPANDRLEIVVLDDPGQGGACHEYDIRHDSIRTHRISFQNGPVNADGIGINGVTHEVLLAILADRLRGFQNGDYANAYNASALEHIEQAQAALQARTKERMARGVEGTHTV